MTDDSNPTKTELEDAVSDADNQTVLILNDAAKTRLRQFIEDEGPKIESRDSALRSAGEHSRANGVPITGCQHFIGSYMSICWLEGWSDTRAPRRECVAGSGFNMTPQQDIEQFTDWIMSLALPGDLAARAIQARRSIYHPDVRPSVN